MWPREHGAYGQLLFPLVTAFAVAGMTAAGALIAVAAAAAFVAHEPLSVLLRRRGARAKLDQGSKATRWLAVCATIGLGAGAAALWLAPAPARWALWGSLLPVAIVALACATGREKSALGEVAVALAFSALAIPVCVVAGATFATAVSISAAFGVLFAASTLAVRIVILRVRGGGNPRAVRMTRTLLLALIASTALAMALAFTMSSLPMAPPLAVVPGLALSVGLAARPPAPARLRTVGWALVTISVFTAGVLIAGL
jgi:hypothetical protein